MRFRKVLDDYFARGLRDGQIADLPPDPFMIWSHPGVVHRDNRHFRRSYDAGFAAGRREAVSKSVENAGPQQ